VMKREIVRESVCVCGRVCVCEKVREEECSCVCEREKGWECLSV
jgi:hypothetical protein